MSYSSQEFTGFLSASVNACMLIIFWLLCHVIHNIRMFSERNSIFTFQSHSISQINAKNICLKQQKVFIYQNLMIVVLFLQESWKWLRNREDTYIYIRLVTSEKMAYSSETLPLPKKDDLLLYTYICMCIMNLCMSICRNINIFCLIIFQFSI